MKDDNYDDERGDNLARYIASSFAFHFMGFSVGLADRVSLVLRSFINYASNFNPYSLHTRLPEDNSRDRK
mgnify:CR=1 FL=1